MSVIETGLGSFDLHSAIVAIQRQFIAEPEPQQAFERAMKLLAKLSQSEFGFIGEVLPAGAGKFHLKVNATSGVATDEIYRAFGERHASEVVELHRLDNLFGEVIRTAKVVISNSPAKDSRSGGAPLGLPPLKSYLGLPFFNGNSELVGMAGLANRRGGYDDALAARLQPICDTLEAIISSVQRERCRREAEAALQASEARLRIFADHVTDGLFLQDADSRVVDVNRRACESLGYTREELIGMTPADFDPAVTSDDVKTNTARLAAGETIAFDSRHRRKDGAEFPVEIRISPLWNDGKLHTLALVCDITERKRAEEKLRESEERLELALHASRMGVWEWDIGTNAVFWSPECYDIYGNKSFDGRAEAFRQMLHPDDVEPLGEKVQRTLDEGTINSWEFRVIASDGQARWIANCAVVRRDESGQAVKLIGTARDITEQKLAEDALREAQQRLAIILKGADVGLWDWDLATDQVVFSAEWKGQLGCTDDEILNCYEDWESRVHPDDLAPALARVKHAIEQCTTDYISEFRMRHKDGSWRWILALGSVLAGADGKPARMLGVHLDITDRKRTEEVLQESEARLRTLLENLDKVAVQAYEPDGAITFWNRASELFYGYSAAEAIGRDRVELLHAEHTREQERHLMAEALRTGKPPAAEEVEVVRSDGSKITIFASRVVHPRAGRSPEFFCFDVDISDRKRAEEELALRQAELLHASRLSTVGQMVAEISHEVAQPLNAIGNFAAASERILETDLDGQISTLHEYVRAILDQNQRCITILGRLRDFSRRAPATRTSCDIGRLLHESVDLMSLELRRNHVVVQFQLAEKLPPVWGDRIQLQQVIVNLLTNSRDALLDQHEDRRMISIRAFVEPEAVVFEVEDAGSGFSGDATVHLFDPFFTTKRHGMGIGLSICQSIVKDHGGRIDALSNPLGGATFRVRLPLTRKKSHD